MQECVNGEVARNAHLTTVNTRPSVVAHVCNPHTPEAGGWRDPEFQASLSDTVKPCHKETKPNISNK